MNRLSHTAAPVLLSWLIVSMAHAQDKGVQPSKPSAASLETVLNQAAADLGQGRLDAAQAGFARAAREATAPPFVQALARLGLAEVSLALKDLPAAHKTWQRLLADTSLPQAYRDHARRHLLAAEQLLKDPPVGRVSLPILPEPGRVFHVAANGNNQGDGSRARPFRSLERARDAVRALKKTQAGKLPLGGIGVVVHGGTYPVQRTWTLTAEDSGTEGSPIVYQAAPGETPVFTGGVRVTGWRPISDNGVRAKLDPSVRDRVVEADLKALGIKDWGDATALRLRPELFCDGVPQTLARWPNQGFVETGEILGKETFKVWDSIPGCKDGKFRYEGDHPSRWTDEPDVRLYGYWFWDWFEEYQKVLSLDAKAHTFTLARPYSQYGYRKSQRYYAVNVFRELDQPGEWYLDRRTGLVYWLPPAGFESSKSTVTLSVLPQPFAVLEKVEQVLLLGLVIQDGRADGIHLRGGSDCLVAGCTLRRLGGDGVVIQGGRHHGLFGCTMSTLGCGGAQVAGGDRKTLTPGNHFVENCSIGDISRLKRTYTPAVLLEGCGNRVAHNLFEKMPSSALRVEGNDHLVELNTIRQVVQESDDQGGVDMFGNPLYRGVVIRWNHWSDITGGTQCGAAGVRLDDMISGVTVQGNVFERCGSVQFGGLQIHGGKDNIVDGNLFLDCFAGISFSRWGEARWLKAIEPFASESHIPLFVSRYPDLARLKKEADVNYISRNVFARCKNVYLRDGGLERTVLNLTTDRRIDPKTLSEERTIRTDVDLRHLLLEPIPFSKIGPYTHPWRCTRSDVRP